MKALASQVLQTVVYFPSAWEFEMGIEEDRGRGWSINTAGYPCMCVYFLSWGSTCHNAGPHAFPSSEGLFICNQVLSVL